MVGVSLRILWLLPSLKTAFNHEIGISNSNPVKTGNEIQKGNIAFLLLIEPFVTLVTVIYLY
jgi:hypothetical protein